MFYFTNEIVFAGHPDKICDRIADALLDAYMAEDCWTRAGIEVSGGKGKIFVTGEVTSQSEVDVEAVVKRVLKDVGYNPDRYEVINNLGKQSPDIAAGVDDGGAGDQGVMFGFACSDTAKKLRTAQVILQDFANLYRQLCNKYPHDIFTDGKAQITGKYNDDWELIEIKDFVISYHNSEENRAFTDSLLQKMALTMCQNYNKKVTNFILNPAGKFEIGGFDADAGMTGRKIVVDSYQGFSRVGGGAFSGKDPSKMDRSAAYKARQIAVRYLKDFNLKWCEVQIAYAIGIETPVSITIDSNQGKITPKHELFIECKPKNIVNDLDLLCLKYEDEKALGHFTGNKPWDYYRSEERFRR